MRVLKPVGFVLLAVALLAIAAVVAAPYVADSARVRQMLAAELSAATGKPVTFAGPVALRLFPRLEVAARDVRVANPPGYSQPWLALVGEMSARVSWPSLLRGDLDIRAASVDGLQLALEEGPAGPNWLLPSGAGGETTLPSLPGEIRVNDATISYRAGTAEAVEVKIDSARIDPGGGAGPLAATLAAHFRGEPIALDARSGSLADLLAGKPLPLRVLLDLGPTRISLDGRMEQPLEGRGLDATVTVDGPGLAALTPFVGGGLPPSAVVSLRAALRDRPAGGFEMGDLRVAFGDSVVEGRIVASTEGQRPRIDVVLRSEALDMADVLGRDTAPPPTASEADAVSLIALPATLPDVPLPFALLRALDAKLLVSADSFRAAGQHITALDFDAALDNGRLVVNRFAGTLGEGGVVASGTIDATVSPPAIDAALQLSGLDIGAMLQQPDIATVGAASARVTLKTTGASPRALATALDADVQVSGIDLRLGEGALPLRLTKLSLRFAGAEQPVELAATGSSRGEALQLTGRLDPLAAYGSGKPYTGTAQLRVGRSQANLTLSQADAADGLRLRFDASGPSLIDLTALAGAPVPLGPYRLAGTAQLTPQRITLADTAVELPGTRLAASGGIEMKGARPAFSLALRGDTLDLDRLEAAFGAPGTQARNRAPVVLPAFDATPLDPALLRDIDLTLDLDVKAVRLAGQDFGPTVAALRLTDGTATLEKFTSDLRGAPLTATGRAAAGADGFDVTLAFTGRDLDPGPLAAELERVRALPAARLALDGSFAARGRSVRDLVLGATGTATLRGLAMTLGDPTDTIADVAIDLPLTTLKAQGRGQPLLIESDGTIAGEAASLRGKVLALDDALASRSVPVELTLETQGSRVALRGDTPDPAAPLDLKLTLDAQGRLLRDLAALGGFDLTPAGPYTAAGAIRITSDQVSVQDVSLQVGESQLNGSGHVEFAAERPRLTAAITAPRLRLEDFDHAAAQAGKAVPGRTPVLPRAQARLLPPDPFPIDVLQSLDGEVTVRAEVIEGYGVVTRKAVLAGKIANGLLTLDDVSAMIEGGRLALRGTVDGRGGTAGVDLEVDSQGVDLGALLGLLAQDEGIPAMLKLPLDSTIRLVGSGPNARSLAATLRGSIRLVANKGYVSQGSFNFIEGGLLRKLAPWEDSDRTTINCFVGDFSVDRGVATARSLLLDTENMSVAGTGTIDLGREQANMVLTPRPKEIRLLNLAVPVSVTGPLANLSITPTATGTARRLITTLGVFVNPLVLIVPVIEGVSADRNPCVAALEKPVASPGAGAPAQPGGILGDVGRGLNRVFGD